MENYKFVEKIGRGTHGTVYLLKSTDCGKYVVCKSVMPRYTAHAQREISILSRLNHRRIVSLIDSVSVRDSVFILLEYANYGTLESMISYFSKGGTKPGIDMAYSVMSQVGDALYYIHSRKIIHRDVKPSNILINRFHTRRSEYLEFKLCDFSLSTRYRTHVDDRCTVGTPYYMAPEMVSRREYTASIDVWGTGSMRV